MTLMSTIARSIIPRKLRNIFNYCTSQDYRDRRLWAKDRQIGESVFEKTGGVVVGGPFKGLRYVATARGSSIGPKLLGTYELELAGIVDQVVTRGYRTVINIGAGEGYYGVGLAARMPASRVICFDSFADNQEQIRTLAKLNGVEGRIDVRGLCDDRSLAEAIGDSTDVLVVCDIEGGEIEVLRPDAVVALRKVDMLVEMHDIVRAGCSEALRERFSGTHRIEVIATRKRTRADFPAGVEIEPGQQLESMDERRGSVPMTFFWMQVKP